MIRKPIIETATQKVANVVSLPDGWTGTTDEWQPPAGHEIGADGGEKGDTWNGASYDKPAPPAPLTDQERIDRAFPGSDMSQVLQTAFHEIANKLERIETALEGVPSLGYDRNAPDTISEGAITTWLRNKLKALS